VPTPPEHDAILSVVYGFINAISTKNFTTFSRVRFEGDTNTVQRPVT
jgi:hypothetical protein